MPEPFEKVVVTRAELEALVRPSLIRSAELLVSTVHKAGVTPEHVYLVGGSCRMPLVAQVIAEKVGIVPTNPDHPETIVASGAQVVDRATITLKPDSAGTLMIFHHAQFFDETARDNHQRGWTEFLGKLESYLA